MRSVSGGLILSALLLAGCAGAPRSVQPPMTVVAPAPVPAVPATYAGDLPCADCTAIRTTLKLRADGLYLLRQIWLGASGGQDISAQELGRWQLQGGDGSVQLLGEQQAPRRFRVLDSATLRQLDAAGNDIVSDLNYELRLTAAPDAFGEPLRLRGLYTYMADAASMQECVTGRRFPVAMAADSLKLERAYLAARAAPGVPLLVTLDGHLDIRPGMEGGSEEVIVVDRFQRAWPGETCANLHPSLPLAGTRWVLSELNGSVMPPFAGGGPPWLLLDAAAGRVQGFGGCNRFSGGYRLEPGRVRFGDLATTQMFCVNYMDVEQAFLGALARADGYRIDGADLALTAGGRTLGWFREGTAPAPP